MGNNSRVVWSEGMFLRPQHFQQHDRHIERWINDRCLGLRAFDWGFKDLTLQKEVGSLRVMECQGRFQDGTPFHMGKEDELPLSVKIADGFTGIVYLCLPWSSPDVPEVDFKPGHARYQMREIKVRDHNSSMLQNEHPVQIGALQTRLMLGEQPGHACLAVAKVKEVRAGNIELDKNFIPPALTCSSSSNLNAFIRKLHSMLQIRAEALTHVTVEAARLGSAGIANFLLLQIINRNELLLKHFNATATVVHPEEFYRQALQLAAELSTFFRENKRPIVFPDYNHDDLQACFWPLMTELEWLLSRGIGTNTVRITLTEWKHGIFVTPNKNEYLNLLDKAVFVLGVKASVSSETLRTGFPHMVKVGPGEDIQQMVSHSLSGIEVAPMLQLPPTLPSKPDFCYFSVNKQGEYWKKMTTSGGFAIHIGGAFPDLELEFWAVQG